MLHAIRLLCGRTRGQGAQQILDRLDGWADQFDRRLTATEQEFELVEDDSNTDDDGDDGGTGPHIAGTYRFAQAEDREAIADTLSNRLRGTADWYLIVEHECDHDEAAREGCRDVRTRTHGDLPEWALELTP
jgi:hypothetical protein